MTRPRRGHDPSRKKGFPSQQQGYSIWGDPKAKDAPSVAGHAVKEQQEAAKSTMRKMGAAATKAQTKNKASKK